MRSFDDVAAFSAAVEEYLGESSWKVVDQARIDLFADATGDHQWIHVDPARAADGPFGATIAHGFLTLSLIPAMLAEIIEVKRLSAFVNYGADRIRFIHPVLVNSRLQAQATLTSVETTTIGVRATINVEVRRDGSDRPTCIADLISVLVGE